jgi:hypothetical protein
MGNRGTHKSLILTSKSLRERDLGSNPSYLQGVPLRKLRNGNGKTNKTEKPSPFLGLEKGRKCTAGYIPQKFGVKVFKSLQRLNGIV